MIHRSPLLRICLLFAGLLLLVGEARAQCSVLGLNPAQIIGGQTVVVSQSYAPFAPADQIHAFTVTVRNTNLLACNFMLSFTRATLPALMSSGPATLQYGIESTGGQSLLQTTGFIFNTSPTAANSILATVGGNSTVNLSVQIRLPAGQTSASAGNYSEGTVTIGIYARSGSNPTAILHELAFNISATIQATCDLPAPDTASLDFTSSIANGLPDEFDVRRVNFTGINCTAPTRVRLTGTTMQQSPPVASGGGFDGSIDWRALAILGNASVTLDTSVTSQVTSSAYNVASGTTVSGAMTVDVNLLQGQPLYPGVYSSVLTVTIDPAL